MAIGADTRRDRARGIGSADRFQPRCFSYCIQHGTTKRSEGGERVALNTLKPSPLCSQTRAAAFGPGGTAHIVEPADRPLAGQAGPRLASDRYSRAARLRQKSASRRSVTRGTTRERNFRIHYKQARGLRVGGKGEGQTTNTRPASCGPFSAGPRAPSSYFVALVCYACGQLVARVRGSAWAKAWERVSTPPLSGHFVERPGPALYNLMLLIICRFLSVACVPPILSAPLRMTCRDNRTAPYQVAHACSFPSLFTGINVTVIFEGI